jgi:general secretion pathway protein B
MSLILEALRKSEAERQVGRAPGLMTPTTVPRRRSHGPLWLLAGAMLVAGAAAGWWFGRPAPAPVMADLQPVGPAVQDAVPPPVAEPVTAPEPTETAVREQPVAIPPAAQPVRPDPAPVTAPAPVVATPPAAPMPQAPPLPAALPPPQAVSPAAVAEAVPEAPLEALPGLQAIDAERRSRLPPLRMSLHMYTEAVETRFVLIDGRRYSEGQTIEPGLEVAEIRRDGVVLAVDGRRVLLTSR